MITLRQLHTADTECSNINEEVERNDKDLHTPELLHTLISMKK